ncbi:PdaC/SigV domain-containing protein [Peribacillus sp. SCS-155]|uniref:PdaC/SigV domain-containing protein n=1 Tax=Peribacillus sedimenti TaxID=3115297 RepID=UPI003906271A
MKKLSSFFRMMSLILLLFVFGSSAFAPSIDTEAAISQKTAFTSHSYKGNYLIRYPQVHGINKNAASKINSTFKKTAEKSYKSYVAIKNAEKAVPKKELCEKTVRCKYSFNSQYQVKYNANGKLSIYYSEYTYTGIGKTHVTMYNFDLTTGKQYKINDILKTSGNYEKVQNYAFKYLSTHEPYSNSVSQISDVTINTNTQFIFTDEGIYLYFIDYQGFVVQYDDGNPFIKIPKTLYQ